MEEFKLVTKTLKQIVYDNMLFPQVHLIEVNTNPALHCNCEALKEVIPGVVEETLCM